ncbi:hypothetical protein SMD11_0101 [Streptomyces albireticuli]|uniref:Uncharacterized protein n=1 Tax=Streptomyces albireticuli TaxID=1940 RepID=A0A1Z2KUN5_9ACTN|nr:hypothetical protein [Streptomyces albireticuli]ARZ65768.1 hypothetical protein SMD11_0101 [Streptomyces albireticuli]
MARLGTAATGSVATIRPPSTVWSTHAFGSRGGVHQAPRRSYGPRSGCPAVPSVVKQRMLFSPRSAWMRLAQQVRNGSMSRLVTDPVGPTSPASRPPVRPVPTSPTFMPGRTSR